jgi:hypothetical protein
MASTPRGCLRPHLRAVQHWVGAEGEVHPVFIKPVGQHWLHRDSAAYASECILGAVH